MPTKNKKSHRTIGIDSDTQVPGARLEGAGLLREGVDALACGAGLLLHHAMAWNCSKVFDSMGIPSLL